MVCRVLKLSRQPHYRWLANPITDSEVVKAHSAKVLFDAHRDDPEFGQCLGAVERWWKTGGEGSDLLSLGRGLHRGGGRPPLWHYPHSIATIPRNGERLSANASTVARSGR